jgi:uncharacterized membrane protein (DUF485 family)
MQKDIALGVMGAVLATAGLLLVFCGLLVGKASNMSNTARATKFTFLAKFGALPLLFSFCSAWVCIMAVEGNPWAVAHGLLMFKISLVITSLYSIISLLSL